MRASGSDDDIMRLAGSGTTVVDLAQRAHPAVVAICHDGQDVSDPIGGPQSSL